MSRLAIIVMMLSIMAIASLITAMIYNWWAYNEQIKKPTMTIAERKQLAEDIAFMKKILPSHYSVKAVGEKNHINCVSKIGIRKSPYPIKAHGKTVMVDDDEDDEHWQYIFKAIKKHFGDRFSEVYHHTCLCHEDFFVYTKGQKKKQAHT